MNAGLARVNCDLRERQDDDDVTDTRRGQSDSLRSIAHAEER